MWYNKCKEKCRNGKKTANISQKGKEAVSSDSSFKEKNCKKVRKAIGQQLSYIRRNLKTIENLPVKTDSLSKQLRTKLETVKKLYEQQKYMLNLEQSLISVL